MQERTGKAALVRGKGTRLLDRTERRTEGGGVGLLRTSGEQAGHRRPLLQRILDAPRIAEIAPRLPPEVLHRVIERCGLEDCGGLVALATPAQVSHVFDLDLWRSPAAGLDAQFDADRFGVWLEVLVAQGTDVAARIVAGLDTELVAAGLSQHVRVFDIATLDGYETTDGTEIPAVIEPDGGLACDIAGRRLIARRPDAWDAIVELLVELGASHHGAFARLMRRCPELSNSRREVDGLDVLLTGAGQAMFDLADEREQRREARGFVSAAQGRAFVESARRMRLDAGAPQPASAILRPAIQPAVRAPAIAPRESETRATTAATSPADAATEAATAAVFELLVDEGVIAAPPLALLGAASAQESARGSALGRFHAHMQQAFARDPLATVARQDEIAWLANALMAGCAIDDRPLTAQEASDAVLATCNLGLECWPASRGIAVSLPDDFLVDHDLVTVFQVGWTVLYDDVCAHAAGRLLDAIADLPLHDPETQADLRTLRTTLLRHLRGGTPWQARDALDVLATLDLPAWTTLLALIAACPVLPAAIDPLSPKGRRTIDPSAFAFISERRQIAAVGAFLDQLPQLLRT
ncbi:MAG: DUF6178 family protein [Vicinamibacteraceae bacterium]